MGTNKIKQRLVDDKKLVTKAAFFVIGAFISALSFNMFYVPMNLVSGGLGSLAIMINKFASLDVNLIILTFNAIFIMVSILTIGLKDSIFSIVGAAVYILFLYVTNDVVSFLNFSFDHVLLYVLAAGVVSGFGEGLVFKSGFTTGGTSILAIIFQKKLHFQLGKAIRLMACIIIACGGLTFGYTSIMYSIIITSISTTLVDKIVIGISESKTFFIQTRKEKEIKEYVINTIGSGITEFDTKGSYTNKKTRVLMCVVPSEKYLLLKSAIEEIDPKAFIVVSDCYEVFGGTKKKILPLDS